MLSMILFIYVIHIKPIDLAIYRFTISQILHYNTVAIYKIYTIIFLNNLIYIIKYIYTQYFYNRETNSRDNKLFHI
jgi:hypothetical protein